MALTKEKKQKILEDLRKMFSCQKAIVLVGIAGLKVKDISELRKKIKGIEGNLKVVKKTLAELAFKESKMAFDKTKFKEEIALAFCPAAGEEDKSSSSTLTNVRAGEEDKSSSSTSEPRLTSVRRGEGRKEDEVLLFKAVYQFSRKNEKLKILGGYWAMKTSFSSSSSLSLLEKTRFENNFIEAEEIIELAQLPSRDELMARLVRGLKSPISNFVNVLGGNIKGLMYVLSRIKT